MAVSVASINLLEDTVVTLYCPGTGDTGVPVASWGTGVIVNVDKLNLKRTGARADHSGGQSQTPVNRFNKGDWTFECELKLFVGLTGATKTMMENGIGAQAKFLIVGTLGGNTYTATVPGIVADLDDEVSGPSTVKVTLVPYGVAATIAQG